MKIRTISSGDPDAALFNPGPGFARGWLLEKAGEIIARVAQYDNPQLRLNEGWPAVLGSFQTVSDYGAFCLLMDHATKHLQAQGFRQLIGPMDGSTWNAYRFALGSETQPFFLEPRNPAWYPEFWERYGFRPLRNYHSALATDWDVDESRSAALQEQFGRQGFRIRGFNPDQLESELEGLYVFLQQAFARNFLFTPISRPDFLAMYRPLLERVTSDLIRIAEKPDGTMAGLAFVAPDLLDAGGQTAIFKTLARLPGTEFRGLGEWILSHTLPELKTRGYTRLIHALMSEGNASVIRSQQFSGEVFCRYVLYQLDLL